MKHILRPLAASAVVRPFFMKHRFSLMNFSWAPKMLTERTKPTFYETIRKRNFNFYRDFQITAQNNGHKLQSRQKIRNQSRRL